MSLPEVLLVLREEHRQESAQALLALNTHTLAAFAVWDKEAGRKLTELQRALVNSATPAEKPSTPSLGAVFQGWGVEVQSQ